MCGVNGLDCPRGWDAFNSAPARDGRTLIGVLGNLEPFNFLVEKAFRGSQPLSRDNARVGQIEFRERRAGFRLREQGISIRSGLS